MAWLDHFRHRRGFRLAGWFAAAMLLMAGPESAEAQTGKIEPRLEQRLDMGGTANFWVRFDDHADLSRAAAIEDWNERGAAVADVLRQTARISQARVRAWLDSEGANYEPFWATNAIYVRKGSEQLAEALAARPEVQSLHPTTTYEVPDPAEGDEARTLGTIAWGVANIRADAVWDQYGVDGAGITIANIDTGVQYDHPALVRQYRGRQEDGGFDHDYNWFDAAGACPVAPCDGDGHGTHTMGTMVGDDGAGTQVGVAPGVRWIAANGCCPDDAALIASAQWMLEPTDLDGRNPDAGKRPHIVNNSWGGQTPSNDPFMEDVTLAWAASGIFGVWSNGNLGPACRTSSAPGSRTANYSTGAYDVENRIADFSSRGAGQDGSVKPDISAPGVDIPSAIPGNRYAVASGTSMAAPHVAGAVALLWSAAPALVGDIVATRARLDSTATDTADDRCDGTAEDNGVYGEGRLDALALLDSAQVRDTGTLATTITDARRRRPIAGAQISVDGLDGRERVTRSDGTYSLPLPPGRYTVTVSAFGYADRTATVTIETGRTTALPLGLTALPRVSLSGRVTDGSGHDWPLYAAITVDGMPNGTFHTDPATGRYRVELPAHDAYTLTVASKYGGYETVIEDVSVGGRDAVRDIAVPVDAERCAAPGYGYSYDGLLEDFDDGAPARWTVADHLGTGNVWRFDDPFGSGNRTGGQGGFAIAQSPGGPGGELDSSLVTPVVDLTGHEAPILRFRQEFQPLLDTARVDMSIDGGTSWETLIEQTSSVRGPREEIVPIPRAAGESDVRLRFHLADAIFNSRYWQIDDVFVGTRTCAPIRGGLVLGNTRDRNTSAALNGVLVTSDDQPSERARSMATPEDPELEDGFYWMFSSLTGRRSFSATVDGYSVDRETVSVAPDGATDNEHRLPAGRLFVDTRNVTGTVRAGREKSLKVTLANVGSAPVSLQLREREGSYEIPRASESATPNSDVVYIEGDFSPLALGAAKPSPLAHWTGLRTPRVDTAGWIDLPNLPTRIMDNTVGELGGRIYSVGGVDGAAIVAQGFVYDPATRSWTRIADLPEPREAAAGAFIGGRFYVVGGWDGGTRVTRTTFVYDPATDRWGTAADDPVFAAAAGRAVLDGKLYLIGGCTNACGLTDVRRYDPATNTWEMLAEYPLLTSHLACAGIAGQVYCTGGIRRGGTIFSSTYAYDPHTNAWTRKADLPIAAWGMGHTGSSDQLIVSGGITANGLTNQSFAYEPASDGWTALPPAGNVVYRGGSTCGLHRVGGSMRSGFVPVDTAELLPTYGDCSPVDVPWLSIGPRTVTIDPGDRVKVSVDLDAADVKPGTYRGGAWIKESTPYLVYPIDVTMTVESRGND